MVRSKEIWVEELSKHYEKRAIPAKKLQTKLAAAS